MFDSHCHLQDKRIFANAYDVIHDAIRAGVKRMLCCGCEENDWADVAGIADGCGAVIPAFGVHPWHVDGISGNWDAVLGEYLVKYPTAAVGEIGLDNVVNPRNDIKQAEIFKRQLEISANFKRPVSIHCRKAWGAMIPILRNMGGLKHGGAIHSYSGPPDLIGELEDLGCYISFSGSILIPGNKRAAESVKKVSPSRLLIETDSPDILPHGAPGARNIPANLHIIRNKAAEILGRTPEEIAALTYDNCMTMFCR